ncbi:hypothetical protein GCM10023200_53130 [Actinomycetospora chlora]|uniref:MucR family transcriptional regulator n=1 Tax=Actinomycetospora chlora TaxID=663608 RepID=A0ABP9CGZ3_9PSEU
MWEPVGPLPPSVYWRRRAVALGVVVALLGGVWALAGLGGGPETVDARARAAALAGPETTSPPSGEPASSTPGPIAAALPSVLPSVPPAGPSDTPAPVLPPGGAPALSPAPDGALFAPPGGGNAFLPPGVPTGSAGPLLATPTTPPALPSESTPPAGTSTSTEPTPAAGPEPAPPGPCADGDLRVTARTDAPTYAAGVKPVLSLVVTNAGAAPCVRDLDAAKQAVAVVVRPGEGLWGSNDCSPGDTDDVRTLAPGEEAVFSVRWSGRTSAPGCTGERTTVPPGTYQLLARLDGIVSEPASFTLEG